MECTINLVQLDNSIKDAMQRAYAPDYLRKNPTPRKICEILVMVGILEHCMLKNTPTLTLDMIAQHAKPLIASTLNDVTIPIHSVSLYGKSSDDIAKIAEDVYGIITTYKIGMPFDDDALSKIAASIQVHLNTPPAARAPIPTVVSRTVPQLFVDIDNIRLTNSFILRNLLGLRLASDYKQCPSVKAATDIAGRLSTDGELGSGNSGTERFLLQLAFLTQPRDKSKNSQFEPFDEDYACNMFMTLNNYLQDATPDVLSSISSSISACSNHIDFSAICSAGNAIFETAKHPSTSESATQVSDNENGMTTTPAEQPAASTSSPNETSTAKTASNSNAVNPDIGTAKRADQKRIQSAPTRTTSRVETPTVQNNSAGTPPVAEPSMEEVTESDDAIPETYGLDPKAFQVLKGMSVDDQQLRDALEYLEANNYQGTPYLTTYHPNVTEIAVQQLLDRYTPQAAHRKFSLSYGNNGLTSKILVPPEFKIDNSAAIWSRAVVTSLGFPFVNFSSPAISTLIHDSDPRNVRDSYKKVKGMFKACKLKKPIDTLKEFANSKYRRGGLNALVVNSDDLYNARPEDTVFAGVISANSRGGATSGNIQLPMRFITSFYNVLSPVTGKSEYADQCGMDEADYMEHLGKSGKPPVYILNPRNIPFMVGPKASLLHDLFSSKTAPILVRARVAGHDGGFLIPEKIVEKLLNV